MKIVADDKIPYIRGVFEPYADITYLPGKAITAKEVKEADALLVRTRTRCDAALLAGSSVRMVATATIGTDHIDLPWCAAHGIKVVSAPGCNAGGVLQWVAAALARTVGEASPAGLTLGIVGIGHVGSLVERYASAWGFRVLRSDPPRETAEKLGPADGYVPLDELAAHSDIVTFHVPLHAEGLHPTVHLAGERFFSALKPGATLFNSSRGGVVDEEQLKRAMASDRCACRIDTWENEPAIDRRLLDAALSATPHIAGYSEQGKANASAAVVAAAAKHFGLPPEGWYPTGVTQVGRRPISWAEMRATITDYFDIDGQSRTLKAAPEQFETLREEYIFRQEYF